jgi:hypothetical protein
MIHSGRWSLAAFRRKVTAGGEAEGNDRRVGPAECRAARSGRLNIGDIESIKSDLRLHRGMRATRRLGECAGRTGIVLAVAALAVVACGGPSPPEWEAGGGSTGTPRPGGSATARGELARAVDPVRDITDLTPSTRGLRLGPPVNGVRQGELVLVIRNNGPAPVPRLMFTVEVPESMTADGGDWAGCTPLLSRKPGFPAGAKCEKGPLGVGETRMFRLGMKSPASADSADSRVSRWLTDVWSAGKHNEYCQDAAPEDNRKIFSVYRD